MQFNKVPTTLHISIIKVTFQFTRVCKKVEFLKIICSYVSSYLTLWLVDFMNFMNFISFIIKFIKFKPIIKFKNFMG